MSGVSLAGLFCSQLRRALQRDNPQGLGFALALKRTDGRPLMLRPFTVPAGEDWTLKGLPFREALRRGALPGIGGVPFRQVLARAFKGIPRLAAGDKLGRTTVWFAVVAACRHASTLIERMGGGRKGQDVRIDAGQVSRDFDEMFERCLSTAAGTESMVWDLADGAVGSLSRGPLPALIDEPPAFVHFVRKRRGVAVRWVSEDDRGSVLWEESLEEFASTAFGRGECREELAGAFARAGASPGSFDESGRFILEAVSPQLARVVDSSREQKRCLAVRLAVGTVPNRLAIPMSVWLHINPDRQSEDGIADVTLAVHRVHEEFVVEGPPPGGRLYYFPPCVLSARVNIGREGLRVHHHPTVLIPKGGAHWNHPYTGDLETTLFTHALTEDGGNADPAYRLPSAGASQVLMGLSRPVDSCRENDLCLDGQDKLIEGLIERFGGKRGCEPDILRLVTGLHDILRMGLTRGHCNNASTPRTKLSEMPYPLPSPSPPAWLRHRVFRYDLQGTGAR